MARKVIGITCGTLPAGEGGSAKQSLNRPYVWAVERAGGLPIILPVTIDEDVIAGYLGVIDGLLLSGGVDIAPERYGEEPHPKLGEVDADRDTVELLLTLAALARDMPIFAICRGIQTLNVALGGKLYQDLPSQNPSHLFHQQSERQLVRHEFSHSIRIERESRLEAIVGATEMLTNSFHHQALHQVAPELVVTARAEDGVIEAAEMPGKRYVVGVQFHPEETAPLDEKSRRLFEVFVSEV